MGFKRDYMKVLNLSRVAFQETFFKIKRRSIRAPSKINIVLSASYQATIAKFYNSHRDC